MVYRVLNIIIAMRKIIITAFDEFAIIAVMMGCTDPGS